MGTDSQRVYEDISTSCLIMIDLTKLLIGKEEKKAVLEVLKSGNLAQGEKVNKLEDQFVILTGAKYAIAVSSGTAALHTALHAVGIVVGDEVITTPFTFVATANSILMQGAKSVFVDIKYNTFNIDPAKIEKAITKKTKAIIAVDLFGQPANYQEIRKIAKKYNIIVIEDAAQSIGAAYNEEAAGNLADISCFSLYATKNIMSGEGGMITTNDKKLAEKARRFRNHGRDEKDSYGYLELGYNYRLTDLQAAIALEQLKKLGFITITRQKNAEMLNKGLSNISGLVLPFTEKYRTHVYHQFTIKITNQFKLTRNALRQYLLKHGIQSNIYYPIPLFAFPHLSSGKNINNFQVTKQVVNEVLSLPVHPLLKTTEIKYIIKTIQNI
jgi:perosamine synthetase